MLKLKRLGLIGVVLFVALALPAVGQQISGGLSAPRVQLTANRTYYVRTDGDDNSGCLANTAAGACRTIQHAINIVCDTIDFGNYQVTIQVGDGTYAEELVLRDYVGGLPSYIDPNASNQATVQNPKVAIVGNAANIDGVIITGTNPSTQFRILRSLSVRPWFIDFLRFDPVQFQDAIEISSGSLNIGTVKFGGSSTTSDGSYAIWVPNKSYVAFQRGANKGSDIYFASNWGAFIVAYDNAWVHMWEHAKWHFQADVAFSYAFLSSGENAYVEVRRLDTIDLGGHTVTGTRWDLWNNGGIYFSLNSGGEQPPSALPGNANGAAGGGGTFNNVYLTDTNPQTADYTLAFADGRHPVYMNKATAVVVTLPNSFPPGWSTTIIQQGAGAVSFAAESGATINSLSGGLTMAGQYGFAQVIVKENPTGAAAVWSLKP